MGCCRVNMLQGCEITGLPVSACCSFEFNLVLMAVSCSNWPGQLNKPQRSHQEVEQQRDHPAVGFSLLKEKGTWLSAGLLSLKMLSSARIWLFQSPVVGRARRTAPAMIFPRIVVVDDPWSLRQRELILLIAQQATSSTNTPAKPMQVLKAWAFN